MKLLSKYALCITLSLWIALLPCIAAKCFAGDYCSSWDQQCMREQQEAERMMMREKMHCKLNGWSGDNKKECRAYMNLHNNRSVRGDISVVDPLDPFERKYRVRTSECAGKDKFWGGEYCDDFKSDGVAYFREGQDFGTVISLEDGHKYSKKDQFRQYLKTTKPAYEAMVVNFGRPEDFRKKQKESKLKEVMEGLTCPDHYIKCICAFATREERGLKGIACVNGEPDPIPPAYHNSLTPQSSPITIDYPCKSDYNICSSADIKQWLADIGSLFEKPIIRIKKGDIYKEDYNIFFTHNRSDNYSRGLRRYLADKGSKACLCSTSSAEGLCTDLGCVPRAGAMERSKSTLLGQYGRAKSKADGGERYGVRLYLLKSGDSSFKSGKYPIAMERNPQGLEAIYEKYGYKDKAISYNGDAKYLSDGSVIIYARNSSYTIKTYYDGMLYPTICSLDRSDTANSCLMQVFIKNANTYTPRIDVLRKNAIAEVDCTKEGCYEESEISLQEYCDVLDENGECDIKVQSVIVDSKEEVGVNFIPSVEVDGQSKTNLEENETPCLKYTQPSSSATLDSVYFMPAPISKEYRDRSNCTCSESNFCTKIDNLKKCRPSVCKGEEDEIERSSCVGTYQINPKDFNWKGKALSETAKNMPNHRICATSSQFSGWDFISGKINPLNSDYQKFYSLDTASKLYRGSLCSDIPSRCEVSHQFGAGVAVTGADSSALYDENGVLLEGDVIVKRGEKLLAKCDATSSPSIENRYCIIDPNAPDKESLELEYGGEKCKGKAIPADVDLYVHKLFEVVCAGDLFYSMAKTCIKN